MKETVPMYFTKLAVAGDDFEHAMMKMSKNPFVSMEDSECPVIYSVLTQIFMSTAYSGLGPPKLQK